MIITNNALDYNKHCSIPFGTYVQAHNENNPTNSMEARALDCIYLRPVYNQEGGHEILDLTTKSYHKEKGTSSSNYIIYYQSCGKILPQQKECKDSKSEHMQVISTMTLLGSQEWSIH